MAELLFGFAIAFLISILMHLALIRPAASVGLVDIAQGRKTHLGRIPIVGGLAMFCGFLLTLALVGALNHDLVVLLTGASLLVLCGLVDDFFYLSPQFKLAVQISTGLGVILFAGGAMNNPGLGWLHHDAAPLIAVALTLGFLVAEMNALNMMDGADGLAGGLALIAAGWLAVAAGLTDQTTEAVALMLLGAVISGFLAFNARLGGRRCAAVFMGDSGSLMLGLLLAAFAARLCQGGPKSVPFVALLWVFALPAIDAASVVIRRVAAGQSPLRADSRHIHQVCRRAGWSVERTVVGLWSVSAVLGGIGVLGWLAGVPDAVLLAGLGVPTLLHLWFLHYSTMLCTSGRPLQKHLASVAAQGRDT